MPLSAPKELPVLPGPNARAFVLLWNPDASIKDFTAIVEGDPGLTASVLRAANSSYSAPLQTIQRASEAIIRIGLDQVRSITLAATMRARFDRLSESGIDGDELWRHLLATGLMTESLLANGPDRELAFTAGLLHDIGRLALASQNPHRYSQVVELSRHGLDTVTAERQLFSTTHSSWGQQVSEAWRLPPAITEVVGGHHHPTPAGLTRAVFVARELAWRLGIGDGVRQPDDAEPEDCPPLDAVLEPFGGPDGFFARIKWFKEAMAPR